MNKQKYRLTRKKLTRFGKGGPMTSTVFVAGDIFVPTDNELRDFGDRLEPLHVGSNDRADQKEAQPVSLSQKSTETEPPKTEPTETEKLKTPKADPGAAFGTLIKDEISGMSVPTVKKAIKSKKFDPLSVLSAERMGKKRPTLIRWLSSRV